MCVWCLFVFVLYVWCVRVTCNECFMCDCVCECFVSVCVCACLCALCHGV